MRSFSFLAFVVLTFCCWGVYGPVLHIGQEQMAGGEGKATLRPFICVGIAYFLIAVVYPLVVLFTKGEKGNWSPSGSVWSFVAGAVGAVGALGIILSFKFGGSPVYVMPLVFGLAPIVNTLVTMTMAGTYKKASIPFFLGIIIVAVGAAGVLSFKPTAEKPKTFVPEEAQNQLATDTRLTPVVFQSENQSDETKSDSKLSDPVGTTSTEDAQKKADQFESVKKQMKEELTKKTPEAALWLVGLCIGVTALCWGAYGPVLHKGQAKMGGSRLRPFLCVGWAYFAIAVIVPYFLLSTFPENGGWNQTGGVMWSLLAGAAGAVGALGIIYAFNFGGKPIFIMPLVFGFAPVVNTLTETISKNLIGQVSTYFMISLLMVILGAVMVLVFAPRGPKPKPASEPATN